MMKKLQQVEKVAVDQSGGEGSATKKLEHNARERIRRLRLNASYLALRALLPDSRRSKKRWSAPAIVDKVIKYIPEMENEIQKLKKVKDDMQSANKNKQPLNHEGNLEPWINDLTVSVNELQSGEAIVQICMGRDKDEAFSKFLDILESEIFLIKSVSTLSICKNRVCYQLHIQSMRERKMAVSSWSGYVEWLLVDGKMRFKGMADGIEEEEVEGIEVDGLSGEGDCWWKLRGKVEGLAVNRRRREKEGKS
ncbi:hypothetical protein ACH5RR_001912 [Cinchona calisaya]|uniref:BHLH domain-containing protein n=1 Tax=Cinchona calisaya TaxID=153742 RepID=A0ABD3B517_9GENT